MPEIETIIQNYFQGTTSEEENKQLLLWLRQSPGNRKWFFNEKDIWDSYGFQVNHKKYEVDDELELLRKTILQPGKPSSHLRQALKIAAILLVTFGLGWATSYFVSSPGKEPLPEITMQEICVPKGQINQVFLADGTRIWLNSGTKLTLPSVFALSERVVKLNGEAYFEVAHDEKKPFRVVINGQEIEVLGTSFNVRAYENSGFIETTLAEGQIQLIAGSQAAVLNPGDQCLFDRINRNLTVRKVDPVIFSSWKNGRFEFQNENLIEVFKVVERWYDVEINCDEVYFKGMYFSGVIKRNKEAKHFLELLNLSVPIRYRIDGDKIEIMSRKN